MKYGTNILSTRTVPLLKEVIEMPGYSEKNSESDGADTVHEKPVLAHPTPEHFQHSLLRWAAGGNLRDYPWRNESDSYRVLIAELMLRRTRADQVVPVYERFVSRWPSLGAFCGAGEGELAEVLYPLGLAWRVENFVEIRNALKQSHEVPRSYDGLQCLPGVGDYVGSAICCFSYGERRPLIDTNSVRVVGRYFGVETGPETRRRKWFREIINGLIPEDEPQRLNYALLDLAAKICRPRRPDCGVCPLNDRCVQSHVKTEMRASDDSTAW
jgi:A/G-specific adenine glycosylase